MENKNVIRQDLSKGEFTTIPIRILTDKRLSGNSFKLLVAILSDSDEFNFSRTRYVNMLDISETTFDKSLNQLIQCGYAKIKKIILKTGLQINKNFYTFSVFGNLKTEEKQVEIPNENNQLDNGVEMVTPNNDIETYLKDSFNLIDERIELKYGNVSTNKLKAIKNACDKWFNDAILKNELPDEQRIINKVASISNSIITANRNENQYYQQ